MTGKSARPTPRSSCAKAREFFACRVNGLSDLINLKWYLRGIGNAIIDQAIHTERMTRDEAMRLMLEDTLQEECEAAAKWVRAQLTSAQLSTYFVGAQELFDLRRDVGQDWGDDFNIKKCLLR